MFKAEYTLLRLHRIKSIKLVHKFLKHENIKLVFPLYEYNVVL